MSWMARIGIALGVLAATLALRCAFLYNTSDRTWPHSMYYEGDAPKWVEWSAAIQADQPFEYNLPIRSPAVAYLLAWLSPLVADSWLLKSAAGGSPAVAYKLIWCFFSALGCAAAWIAFSWRYGLRVGAIATSLCIFGFSQYVIATSLNNEVLYVALLVPIVAGAIRLRERPSIWLAILLGLLNGAATLVRVEHQLLLLMLMVYCLWPQRKAKRVTSEDQPAESQATSAEDAPSADGRDARTSRDKRPHHIDGAASGARFGVRVVATIGTLVVAVGVCLPWAIHGWRATAAFNASSDGEPDYQSTGVVWTEDARTRIDSLPAFCRRQNVAYLSHVAIQRRMFEIDADAVDTLFRDSFDYVSEPLSRSFFISSQGPLSFALANHPDAGGGFSKAALDDRFQSDPELTLSIPSHLRLYNHGYRIGWEYIRGQPGDWARLVGQKLLRFADGVTPGLTSRGWPFGPGGVRRSVDIITPQPGGAPAWRYVLFALLGVGFIAAIARRQGGAWVLVILYKLAVTVLFYGYARQAASIWPAFALFIAFGIDAVFCGGERFVRLPRPASWIALGVIALGLGGLDVYSSTHPASMRVRGKVDRTPQWAPYSFESYNKIELIPEIQTSATDAQ
jgi:hypothetical protein